MPSLLDRILSPAGLGAGLIGASAFGRDEPGYVTESRQFLRNRFASPRAIPQEYTQGLSELVAPFTPLLDQQQQRVLDLGLNRTAQLFPSSTGPQPGYDRTNFLNLARDQFLPQRNALLGDLALKMLDTRGNAANEVLRSGRPDALSEALGQLGAVLLATGGGRSILGQESSQGQSLFGDISGGVNQLSDFLLGDNFFGKGGGNLPGGGPLGWIKSLLAGGQGTSKGGNLLSQLYPQGFSTVSGLPLATNAALQSQLLPAVSDLFGGQVASFGTMSSGQLALLNNTGQTIGYLAPNGVVTTANGQMLGSLSQGGTVTGGGLGGLLSSLATPVASGLGGFFSGRAIGGLLPQSQLGGTVAGAAGGAAAGAAAGAIMGSIFDGPGAAIGAIIGGLTGAGGGFLGSRSAAKAQKAKTLAADMASQGDTWGSISSFWTSALGEAGYSDLEGWNGFLNQSKQNLPGGAASFNYAGISGSQDQPDDIAYVGSRILLKEIQKNHPEVKSLDGVKDFRKTYVDFILANTYIEQGGQKVKTQNIGQKGSLLSLAGLPY